MPEDSENKDEKINKPVTCAQCGKPALMRENNVPLCIDCCAKVEYIHQLRLTRLVDLLNYNSAQIDSSLGFSISPKMNNFSPQPPSGTLFLNNISIDRSTIGSINTGTIQNLDNTLTIFKDQNQVELADSIKKFTEAVIQSNEIAEEVRQEIIEGISYIADQITKSKQERKSTITKTLLERLPTILQTASGLITLWKQIEPLVISALNQ